MSKKKTRFRVVNKNISTEDGNTREEILVESDDCKVVKSCWRSTNNPPEYHIYKIKKRLGMTFVENRMVSFKLKDIVCLHEIFGEVLKFEGKR